MVELLPKQERKLLLFLDIVHYIFMVWDIIEFVEGRGTVNELNTYRFIDRSASQGVNYYRLQQLDFEGQSEFSKVISASIDRRHEIVTFPNPVDNRIIIVRKDSKEVNIQIYNTFGQVVCQKTQLMDTRLVLDVSMIENGNYFLNITNIKTGTTIYQEQIVKISSK